MTTLIDYAALAATAGIAGAMVYRMGVELFARPRHPCADGHLWQHYGGASPCCARDCYCSVPVYVCDRCGDCDYGDNREGRETVALCQAARFEAALSIEPMAHRCETCGVKDSHAVGCPENDPPDELPDGLFDDRDGRIYYTCRGCDQSVPLECDLDEFDPAVAYCGGSPRCLP